MVNRTEQMQTCHSMCQDLRFDYERLGHERQCAQRKLLGRAETEDVEHLKHHGKRTASGGLNFNTLADPEALDLLAKPVASKAEEKAREDLLARYGGSKVC